MTQEEKDRRDLEYLEGLTEEPDMSPGAITERLYLLARICELSQQLGLPDIEYFKIDASLITTN